MGGEREREELRLQNDLLAAVQHLLVDVRHLLATLQNELRALLHLVVLAHTRVTMESDTHISNTI